MEYNTQRPSLKITDYGRSIYKLINYAKGIEDRTQRSRVAAAITRVMARMAPDADDTEAGMRRYWVHLMILSDWQLDVDMPYVITPEETVNFAPHPLQYQKRQPHFRHYGSVMEHMVARVAEYPEGDERDRLVAMLAHAMKRDYLLWNRDTIEDQVVTDQLHTLSQGRLQPPSGFQYCEAKEYLKGIEEEQRSAGGGHKKRKKKKK